MLVSTTIDQVLPDSPPEAAIPSSPDARFGGDHKPMPLLARILYIIAIIAPLAGLIAGMALIWNHGYGLVYLSLFVGGYLFSAFGITVGYHRLFCHRAFETHAFIRYMFGVMGSMAVEGSVIKWCSVHRCHHQHSDIAGDPHSPYLHGSGFLNMVRGLWHAHAGWMFQGDPQNLSRIMSPIWFATVPWWLSVNFGCFMPLLDLFCRHCSAA